MQSATQRCFLKWAITGRRTLLSVQRIFSSEVASRWGDPSRASLASAGAGTGWLSDRSAKLTRGHHLPANTLFMLSAVYRNGRSASPIFLPAVTVPPCNWRSKTDQSIAFPAISCGATATTCTKPPVSPSATAEPYRKQPDRAGGFVLFDRIAYTACSRYTASYSRPMPLTASAIEMNVLLREFQT